MLFWCDSSSLWKDWMVGERRQAGGGREGEGRERGKREKGGREGRGRREGKREDDKGRRVREGGRRGREEEGRRN